MEGVKINTTRNWKQRHENKQINFVEKLKKNESEKNKIDEVFRKE